MVGHDFTAHIEQQLGTKRQELAVHITDPKAGKCVDRVNS